VRDTRNAGFTLIEIMIVVLIIGMLTTLVATTIFGRLEQSKVDIAGMQIQKLSQALELYKLDNGVYPTSEQGLDALVHEATSEPRPRRFPPGGYANPKDLVDPWQSQFKYARPGQNNPHSYDLYSLGSDGVEGGEADVGNWETARN
jgi:general secretion pathway protein G